MSELLIPLKYYTESGRMLYMKSVKLDDLHFLVDHSGASSLLCELLASSDNIGICFFM